jgi:hypothetical protein
MITESKLKSGTLTFTVGGTPVDFSCQPTNVRISPKHDEDGDPVETLCGDVLGAEETRTDSLLITAIQDFDDPDGFQSFSWENDRTSVPFSWRPNATSPTYTGTVKVRALEVGGDVNKRLTVDAEWPCVGAATRTPAA